MLSRGVVLYAIDATHLLRRRRRDAPRVDKNRAQFEGAMQRWPRTGNGGRSATPAAASPPMLRRETAAWGVRMLLQARRSSATTKHCRIVVSSISVGD